MKRHLLRRHENPSDGSSWFRLGTCLHRLNPNQESRDAFQKALDLRFQALQAMVVIARSHYKENHSAEAAKWLTQAVDAGFSNTALLDRCRPAWPAERVGTFTTPAPANGNRSGWRPAAC